MPERVPSVPGNARIILTEEEAKKDKSKWLKMREVGISATAISAILGINPYQTSFDVFRSKAAGWKENWVEPDLSDNPAVQAGVWLEEPVAQKAAEMLGLTVRTGGGLWQSIDHPVAIATPDRILTKPKSWEAVGLIECKTAGDTDGWSDVRGPAHYEAQLQWQLGILGLDKGWLACQVFNRDRSFFLVELDFDPVWYAEMVAAAEQFWADHIETGEPPMHDLTHPRTAELIKEQHPKVVRESVELDETSLDWVKEYQDRLEEKKAAEARLEEAQNFLKLAIGDAAEGYYGNSKLFSYNEHSKESIDTKLLREKYPEIAAKVTKRSTYRQLWVSKHLPRQEEN